VYLRRNGVWELHQGQGPQERAKIDSVGVDRLVQVLLNEDVKDIDAKDCVPALEHENVVALTQGQKRYVKEGMQEVRGSDQAMWRALRAHDPGLPRGFETLLLEVFSGDSGLTIAATEAGATVGQPCDWLIDGADMYDPTVCQLVAEQIDQQKPYALVAGFPCTAWGPWSGLNMSKSEMIEKGILEQREKARPMLAWLAKMAVKIIDSGGIIIFENPLPSAAWKEPSLAGLIGHAGPNGVPVRLLRIDQCAYGLTDADSNLPVFKPTGILTNARCADKYLNKRCSKDHEHERLAGSNSKGPRARQAASWPKSLIKAMLRTIVGESSELVGYEAYPAEMRAEEMPDGSMDAPDGDDVGGAPDIDPQAEDLAEERLRELHTDGLPVDEQAAKTKWLTYPLHVRAAIRRLHRMTGHSTHRAMERILRGARAAPSMIEAVASFRCEGCRQVSHPRPMRAVKPPGNYEFNAELGIDVLEVRDADGVRYSVMSVLCQGTLYHAAAIVRDGGGTPSSQKCLNKLNSIWIQWAGWPRAVVTDRGLHNRGAMSRALVAHGVYHRQAGLESPAQLGRTERHGGLLKELLRKCVHSLNIRGRSEMKQALITVLNTKNQMMRNGGFSPTQWVLGHQPRLIGSLTDDQELGQLGVLSDEVDPQGAFARQAQLRSEARKHFVQVDCDDRYKRSQLRRAAPLLGEYRVGDVIMYHRVQGATQDHHRWRGPARIIGFEKDVVWVVHSGVPIATAMHLLRPAESSEVLAKLILSRNAAVVPDPFAMDLIADDRGDQQGFLDLRQDGRRVRRRRGEPVPDADQPTLPTVREVDVEAAPMAGPAAEVSGNRSPGADAPVAVETAEPEREQTPAVPVQFDIMNVIRSGNIDGTASVRSRTAAAASSDSRGRSRTPERPITAPASLDD